MTQQGKISFSYSIRWFTPIVIFYLALGSFLILVSLFVESFDIPQNFYELSFSNPLTVFVAPFTGPLFDSFGSTFIMFVLLFVFLLLSYVDQGFQVWTGFRLAFCIIPIISGVLASILYMILMEQSGLILDGSRSSIIAASLNGMLIVLALVSSITNLKRRNTIDTAFSLVLLVVIALAYHLAFLDGGNILAHLYGFFSGALITTLYLFVVIGSRSGQFKLE